MPPALHHPWHHDLLAEPRYSSSISRPTAWKAWSPGGPVDAWEVAVLEPNRFLGLRGLTDLRGRNLDPKQPRPSAYIEGLWGFLLNELAGERTRLVIGGYQAIRPRWLGRFVFYWLYFPVVWLMQARTLAVLKRNIEQAARA